MSTFEIAQAIPEDAPAIGALRARNWTEQYAHLDGVTKAWMDAEVERIAGEEGNRRRSHWIKQANLPNANNYWLVARTGIGAIAGFLEARRHDNNTQELRSLHVVSERRGLGIGQVLLDTAHSVWFNPDVETFLDVAEVNGAGQRFYLRPPNNYEFTDHGFSYGPIIMSRMKRRARS